MARWFFVSGSVRLSDATLCSGFAGTATADNVTAATPAVSKPAEGSVAALTAVTSEVPKDGSIIGTGSGVIAAVAPA